MLARCARCQSTFTTDHYGTQACPHCSAQIVLEDPFASKPPASSEAPQPSAQPTVPDQVVAGAPPPGSPPASQPTSGSPPHYGAWGPPPGWAPPPVGADAPVSSPFAQRERLGFVNAYLQTWKMVALDPARFFRNLRIDETGSAVGFGVISGTLGTWFTVLFTLILPQTSLEAINKLLEGLPNAAELPHLTTGLLDGFALGIALIAPLSTLIWMFLLAAIYHLFLMVFGGAHRGFNATLTAVGYARGLSVLMAIPWIGGIAAGIWGLIAVIFGLDETHRCGMGKAVAAGFGPSILSCCCCCVPGITLMTVIMAKAAGA
jgi:hypothetical protein